MPRLMVVMISTFIPSAGPAPAPSDAARILNAALALLEQGEELLESVPIGIYSTHIELAFNASAGGHYRHCLDHFASVIRGASDGIVDFDHRERDVRLEQDPKAALEVTRHLRAAIGRIPSALLDQPMPARCEVSYHEGVSPVTRSSLGRELVYAIAHGIHHYALIAVIIRLQGGSLPTHFGVAPSTVHYLTSLPAQAGETSSAPPNPPDAWNINELGLSQH